MTELAVTDNPTLLNMRKRKARPYTGNQLLEEEEDTNTPNPEGGPDGNPNPDPNGRVDANLTPEEKTYAKRYADLRRLEQTNKTTYEKKLRDMADRIAELEDGSGNKLPVSEAEINDWMAKYPDLANAILHVADKSSSAKMKKLKDEIDKLQEDSLEIKREKAYLELKKLHPDVDAIRETQEFHDWVETQPGEIQAWFYENETDHVLAARGISLFKLETGWKSGKKKEKKNENLENSREVTSSKAPDINPEGGQKKTWRESEITKLKPKEFEALEEELELAMREGRIIHDLKNSRI